jgi:hypothetical protein
MDLNRTGTHARHRPHPWLANVAIVVVYLGTRLLSHVLALPAGYATPVYLPAGVGFALAVVFGWRVIPGIAIGAALTHLPDGWIDPDTTAWKAVTAMVVATLGSMLQAWLGARWFRRMADPALGTARDVARFLALAPVFCLVNATCNIATLYRLGLVTAAERAPNWINWWAGDTVGVLLAAPLVWIVCGQPRQLWRRRARLVALPLLLATGVVIVAYEQTVQWEHQKYLQSYRLKAQQVADELQAELREHERFVDTFSRALGKEDRYMGRDRFLRTASGYVDGRPEIVGIDWLVPVTNAERATFEDWVRKNVDPDFPGLRDLTTGQMLHPAGTRALYLPMLYTWPHSRMYARGLDFLAAPGRSEAVARALVSTDPVATGPITLFATGTDGIALFRVVGEPGQPPLSRLRRQPRRHDQGRPAHAGGRPEPPPGPRRLHGPAGLRRTHAATALFADGDLHGRRTGTGQLDRADDGPAAGRAAGRADADRQRRTRADRGPGGGPHGAPGSDPGQCRRRHRHRRRARTGRGGQSRHGGAVRLPAGPPARPPVHDAGARPWRR